MSKINNTLLGELAILSTVPRNKILSLIAVVAGYNVNMATYTQREVELFCNQTDVTLTMTDRLAIEGMVATVIDYTELMFSDTEVVIEYVKQIIKSRSLAYTGKVIGNLRLGHITPSNVLPSLTGTDDFSPEFIVGLVNTTGADYNAYTAICNVYKEILKSNDPNSL